MGKIVMIQNPIQENLNMMIDKMAPAMNKGSIIIVNPLTWEELIDELMKEVQNYSKDTDSVEEVSPGCTYKGIRVYRSHDYPLGQWGIYL
jgi:hypothetical protein